MKDIEKELEIFKEIDLTELSEKTKEFKVELNPLVALIFFQLVKDKIKTSEINQFVEVNIIYDTSDDEYGLMATENMSVDFTDKMMNILLSNHYIKDKSVNENYNLPVYGVASLDVTEFLSNKKEEHEELLQKMIGSKELSQIFLPIIYNLIQTIEEKKQLENSLSESSLNDNVSDLKNKHLKI